MSRIIGLLFAILLLCSCVTEIPKDGKAIIVRLDPSDSEFEHYASFGWHYRFSKGLTTVAIEYYDEDGYYVELVIVDKYGNRFPLPESIEVISRFEDGLAAVCIKDDDYRKYGYIDETGEIVMRTEYMIYPGFADGFAVVSSSGTYGVIDKTGKIIIPVEYSIIPAYIRDKGLFSVGHRDTDDDRMYSHTYDLEGNLVDVREVWVRASDPVDEFPGYTVLLRLEEGLVFAKKNDMIGALNQNCDEIVPFIYDMGSLYRFGFNEGLVHLRKDGKWGYLDKTGVEVVPFIYNYARGFSNGLAFVEIYEEDERKFIFIDKNGNVAIELPCHYNVDYGFDEYGYAIVYRNDGQSYKYGLIDTNGNVALPLIYDAIYSFSDGLAWVVKDNMLGIIEIVYYSSLFSKE